ncbi:MATE family efflux transporter [Jannaschia pohangensis]|uniref:Na+-driven multidrug efflux pump n=1 Tax=Jannaschia pohangensis TaxID=390807 RepID=A0A1I3HCK6_9RHOB|nr:MATE family efflux transporter [Jannaschia pohangensis]SFI33381.1 Na+-driven multidrug efflux pump [Jannaschia pohangensis]
MTSEKTVGDIYAVAWPLALKAIMLHGIVVIDAYLISALGEAALAAMGLAGALVGLLLGLLVAFSNATQIRIAQSFGIPDPAVREVGLKSALASGLTINLVSILLGLVFVALFGPMILRGFAQTPWIAEQAQAYLTIFALVVVAEAFGQSLDSYFNGCGRTKLTFSSYLISMPVNVGVSIVLIHGLLGAPELGVAGAAWGSAAGAILRALFLGVQLQRQNRFFRDVAGWARGRFGWALRRHFAFSWPIAATFLSMSVGTQVCVLIYARMDITDFAAITLIMPWVQVAGTFGMAWAQATGIIVAQLLGASLAEDALDSFLSRAWRVAFLAAGVVAAVYLTICLASPWLYPDLEAQTRTALMLFLPTLLLLPFPKGSNAICGQTLRASGDTFHVMNIFIAGQWLFKVPMTLLFVVVLDLSVGWVFALFLFEELVKFPPFHLRLFKGGWKRADVQAD